jgi:septal ring factor EnvC (AmiA/AmiB activator)
MTEENGQDRQNQDTNPAISQPEERQPEAASVAPMEHAENADKPAQDERSSTILDHVTELEQAWDQVDEEIETYSGAIDDLLARKQALQEFVARVAGDLGEVLDDKASKIDKIFADEYKKLNDSASAAEQAAAAAAQAAGIHSRAQERSAELGAEYAELQAFTSETDAALDAMDEMRRVVETEQDSIQKFSKLKRLVQAMQALEMRSADAHIAALRGARTKLRKAQQAANDAAASLAELEAAASAAGETHKQLAAETQARIAEKIAALSEVGVVAA